MEFYDDLFNMRRQFYEESKAKVQRRMSMKCFYHGSDLDGYCSGAIVKYRYPECEMQPIDYGAQFPMDKIELGETVYMVDFALQPFD